MALENTSDETKKFQKELNAGTTALVLLSVLKQASAPMYGYQIAKHIEASSENRPSMEDIRPLIDYSFNQTFRLDK